MSAPESLAPLRAGMLVGGSSRRMGRPKALVRLEGRQFAERVAEALRSVAVDLVLLGDGPVPESLDGLPRLADPSGLRGPMAAVLAALRARPDSAWLIAACDQPLASAAACRWLLAARRRDRLAVLPALGQGPAEPLLAIYEPGARGPIEDLAAAGERSLQPFARLDRVSRPQPPEEIAEAWRSVDSEPQLRELEERLRLSRRSR